MDDSRAGGPRPIGYWLVLVDRLIDERFAATLMEHGVTRRQWQLLTVLRRGDADVASLDAAVSPFLADDRDDPESSAEHLEELVESGWVALAGDAYSLTETGSAAFERLSDVVEQERSAATEGVSDEEYRQTLAVLERMARNLGWTG